MNLLNLLLDFFGLFFFGVWSCAYPVLCLVLVSFFLIMEASLSVSTTVPLHYKSFATGPAMDVND